ncbi:MAG: ribonuclease T [Rhodanobacteraceae bacterium]|nr:MAG: ribonuclease T [Rhodanobacteraceae bacterium]
MHKQLENYAAHISTRFRGFLPVVVDVETGGFDARHDALLEIAAVIISMDGSGVVTPEPVVSAQVEAFPGSHLDPKSLEVNGIDPDQPLRGALPEREALDLIFKPVRAAIRATGCQRAILVGHNAHFDLGFLNAAVQRTGHKRNPFHPFSCFDTATLGGLAYGQTVLSRAVQAAGFEWDANAAHSAVYDTEHTAALFCAIVNRWHRLEQLERERVGAGID